MKSPEPPKIVGRSANVLKEFRSFALKANAIDLAIGVIIGAAFTAVVNSVVKDLFTPLIAAIFGSSDFSSLSFTINGSKFFYGDFINAIISFVIVAAVVFFFVVKPQAALRRRMGWEPPEEPQKDACPQCTTDIPVAARRCPACTSELGEGWSAPSDEGAVA